MRVFSRSVDALMDRIGLDAAARKHTGQSLFTLQMISIIFARRARARRSPSPAG